MVHVMANPQRRVDGRAGVLGQKGGQSGGDPGLQTRLRRVHVAEESLLRGIEEFSARRAIDGVQIIEIQIRDAQRPHDRHILGTAGSHRVGWVAPGGVEGGGEGGEAPIVGPAGEEGDHQDPFPPAKRTVDGASAGEDRVIHVR
jgi:hypothetical protein